MSKQKLQKLPIGVQSFEKLRTQNYLYIDKTEQIYNLAINGDAYFLSRPRRFGKSMLCSTFKALFEGKKNLFEGTWIGSSDWEWKTHPVIHIDMSELKYTSPQELEKALQRRLIIISELLGVALRPEQEPNDILSLLITALATNTKILPVLIIDEYDKPIVNSLKDIALLEQYRNVLYNFYGPLKPLGHSLRFLFITGVSQFSKLSVFSALNHLDNLSSKAKSATVCGYTQAELEHYFVDHIAKAEAKFGYDHTQMLAEIKRWYNGYCFTDPAAAPERVYNPFSVINFFDDLQFKNYWFASGTPTFVIDYFKQHEFSVADFEQVKASESILEAMLPEKLNLTTLLYQTGYLTIKSYADQLFILAFPNYEVAQSCAEGLLHFALNQPASELQSLGTVLRNLFLAKSITAIQLSKVLKEICAHIPSTIAPDKERGYQLIFYLVLQLSGLDAKVEEPSALGRMDITIFTNAKIFVIELKIRGTAQKALEQIANRRYDEKYLGQGKDVVRMGVVFDAKKRTITDCEII